MSCSTRMVPLHTGPSPRATDFRLRLFSHRLRLYSHNEHEHDDASTPARPAGYFLFTFHVSFFNCDILAFHAVLQRTMLPWIISLSNYFIYAQGTWTGIYQAGGSLARILGPIYLTNMYTLYGTGATFGSSIGMMLVVIGVNLYLFKHLIPLAHRGRKI